MTKYFLVASMLLQVYCMTGQNTMSLPFRVEVFLNGTKIDEYQDKGPKPKGFDIIIRDKKGNQRKMPIRFLSPRLMEFSGALSSKEGAFNYAIATSDKTSLVIGKDKSGKQIPPIEFSNEPEEGIFFYYGVNKTRLDANTGLRVQFRCFDNKTSHLRTFIVQLTEDQNIGIEVLGTNGDKIPLRGQILGNGRSCQLSF